MYIKELLRAVGDFLLASHISFHFLFVISVFLGEKEKGQDNYHYLSTMSIQNSQGVADNRA